MLRLNEDQLKLMGISDSKLRCNLYGTMPNITGLMSCRHTLAGVIARLKVRQAQIEISGLMKGNQNMLAS